MAVKNESGAVKGKRGGNSLADQIKILESKVGPEGTKKAQAILDGNDPDVIRLAFKKIAKPNTGLPKTVETLLANVPAGERDALREKLMAAKAS